MTNQKVNRKAHIIIALLCMLFVFGMIKTPVDAAAKKVTAKYVKTLKQATAIKPGTYIVKMGSNALNKKKQACYLRFKAPKNKKYTIKVSDLKTKAGDDRVATLGFLGHGELTILKIANYTYDYSGKYNYKPKAKTGKLKKGKIYQFIFSQDKAEHEGFKKGDTVKLTIK